MSHEDIPYAFVLITTAEMKQRIWGEVGSGVTRSWYRPLPSDNPVRLRRDDFDMLPSWWADRQRHNDDGPAVLGPTRDSWYINGFVTFRVNKDGTVWMPGPATLAKRAGQPIPSTWLRAKQLAAAAKKAKVTP